MAKFASYRNQMGVILGASASTPPSSYEDLTTYTEVDPETDFAVTSTTLTVTDMHTEHVAAYIYKDYTADYFTKDLEIQFEFVVTDPNNGQDTSDMFGILSLNSILGTRNSGTSGPTVRWTPKMVSNQIQLFCGDNNYATSYATFIAGAGVVFYCTLTRVSVAAPGDCSILLDVYSDSARTIRMNMANGNPSIQYGRNDIPTVDGLTKYRYLQLGTSEKDSADTTAYGSYYIQNVEIVSH